MKQPIHVLYISGFGDNFDKWRLRALKLWRYRGVTVELVPMKWDEGTFVQKIARLDRAVDRAKGKRIVLIGESGGGSMAVHMYARRPDDFYKVMTLCGKNTHPETVGESYFARSPAFKSSMEQLNESLEEIGEERSKQFVSLHPLYDPIVPVSDTLLPSCRQVQLLSAGHLITIALGLTVYSPILIHALKRK